MENNKNKKDEQLEHYRVTNKGKPMTTNQSVHLTNDEETLKAGERGPSLHEDFHYFEKITHFVHEEIPERKVHARGYGAHGEFECYDSMKQFTKAGFLQEAGKKTPVFVRFSTVQGSKGSKDTTRDLRCKGVKFYTEEGNYDLTTIAMPVLINQDPMKFPDVIHAYQPEPRTGMPTATGAHDNFWDYVANNQESLHMVLWIMSDRGIIKNYRMMESWAINTYLFVNDEDKATFVRFVWKPVLGVHSLLQDEAQKIGGIDPDYHRRDLREAINRGAYPEYELGVQLIPLEDEFKYDFDILDPAKYWPEEEVPVQLIGKMTLNKNVDNEFAELEQVAFNPANVVPGIDFSNDPVLQGRLIVYQSAQYHRLGSANFQDLPINKPLCPFHNNQQKGYMRYQIDVDQVNYHNNSLADNTPFTTSKEDGGYEHYPTKLDGHVVRGRSDSFNDFFSQPRIFWNSLSPMERQHTMEAFSFQLGKVVDQSVRQQNVDLLANVDTELANTVADHIGVKRPSGSHVNVSAAYPSLSQENTNRSTETQKVGIIIANGFDSKEVNQVIEALEQAGTFVEVVGESLQDVVGMDEGRLKVNKTFITTSPYLLDAIYVVGGNATNKEKFDYNMQHFIQVAFEHYKPIGIASSAIEYFQAENMKSAPGVVMLNSSSSAPDAFIKAIGQHRFWERKVYH